MRTRFDLLITSGYANGSGLHELKVPNETDLDFLKSVGPTLRLLHATPSRYFAATSAHSRAAEADASVLSEAF